VSASAAQRAANRHGILCMSAAMAAFIVNDAFVKLAAKTLPIAQLIFLRSLLVMAIMFIAVRASGAMPKVGMAADRNVMLRSVIDASATLIYLLALTHLPLANATAINLATPLIMTLFAVLFLRERVGLDRWAAIATGFAGVILVMQPKVEGFNVFALVALGATTLHATRDLMTRRLPAGVPSTVVTFSTAIAASLMSGVWSAVQGWQQITAGAAGLVVCASLFVAAGFYLIVAGMRSGEMSVVGPFRYSGLLMALFLGYVIWGDVPNAMAWGGIVLMIASGIYIIVSGRRPA
jgi:drug/metabolite transporter (DMT)-like permease